MTEQTQSIDSVEQTPERGSRQNRREFLKTTAGAGALLAIGGTAAVSTVSGAERPVVELHEMDRQEGVGGSTTFRVKLSNAPGGLAGYSLAFTSDNTDVATIGENPVYPDVSPIHPTQGEVGLGDLWGGKDTTVEGPGRVTVRAFDGSWTLIPGLEDIDMVEFTVNHEGAGDAIIGIEVDQLNSAGEIHEPGFDISDIEDQYTGGYDDGSYDVESAKISNTSSTTDVETSIDGWSSTPTPTTTTTTTTATEETPTTTEETPTTTEETPTTTEETPTTTEETPTTTEETPITTRTLSASDVDLTDSNSGMVDVVLNEVPADGLAGYEIDLSIADTGVATFESGFGASATYPSAFSDVNETSLSEGSATIKASDANDAYTGGEMDVLLASVPVVKAGSGTTSVSLSVTTLQTDGAGVMIDADLHSGTIEAETGTPTTTPEPVEQVPLRVVAGSVPSGETTTAEVVMDSAPNGISGFGFTVDVSDSSLATITGVNPAVAETDPDFVDTSVASDGSSATLSVADTVKVVGESDDQVTLATIDLQAADASGTVTLSLSDVEVTTDRSTGESAISGTEAGELSIGGDIGVVERYMRIKEPKDELNPSEVMQAKGDMDAGDLSLQDALKVMRAYFF